MTALLPFVFETVRQRANDPSSSRFFLPDVLHGLPGKNAQGKLLPLEETSWDIGEVKGVDVITVSFCDQWANILQFQKVDMANQMPIASPDSPYPTLSLGNDEHKLLITGLANLFVEKATQFKSVPNGYRATLNLKFNHWDGSKDGATARPTKPPLTFAGGFLMSQNLCTADIDAQGKPKSTCNGNESVTVNGAGTIEVEVHGAVLNAVVDILVDASNTLQATLVSLNMCGAEDSAPPQLKVKALQIETDYLLLKGAWQSLTEKAINSEDGRKGIFDGINAALNEPGNRNTISGEMTAKLGGTLDSVLGKPATPPPTPAPIPNVNPTDNNLFQRIFVALNQPTSDLFLPQLICQNKNPSLSPLNVKEIALGDINVKGLMFESNQLSNVNFTGLSNLKIPPEGASIAPDALRFEATLGGWNPPPPVSCPDGIPAPPATGMADFLLKPQFSEELQGSLGLTVHNMTVEAVCNPTGEDVGSLQLNLQKLQLKIGTPTKQLTVEPHIESAFKSFIKTAVNTDNILISILNKLNEEVHANLPSIDKELTQHVREAIAKGLD